MRTKAVSPALENTPSSVSTPIALPLKQAAQISGLTVWALRNAIWGRRLVARLAGKRLLVLHTDLEAYVASLPQVFSGPCNRSVR
jgi:hypothetical protein